MKYTRTGKKVFSESFVRKNTITMLNPLMQ